VQSVPKTVGPLLDKTPDAEPPATVPDTEAVEPVLRVPDAENLSELIEALPRTIVLVWLCPSAQVACHTKVIASTDVGVTVNEIGSPWLVVPTKLPAPLDECLDAAYPAIAMTIKPTTPNLRNRK
jgi:hypothetical protein